MIKILNWIDYIIEAKRCLIKNGWLFIAETTNQLNARLSTLRDEITKRGLQMLSVSQMRAVDNITSAEMLREILDVKIRKCRREMLDTYMPMK